MARNGQGIYSLPEAAFVPGTVISSAAVNEDFSDIATALTDSVAADGQTPITGALKSAVTSTPGFTSNADVTTGFGIPSAGNAAIYASGTQVIQANNSIVSLNAALNVSGNTSLSGSLVVLGSITVDGALNLQSSTGAFGLPDGTTAQRPGTLTQAQGQVRYNNSYGNFEGFDGTEYQNLSSQQTAITLAAAVAGNLLTVSVLNAKTGSTPSATDPITITFRDATTANGDPVSVLVNSALTINTNGVGASLGATLANQPFRFWVVAFNNGGAAVLGLINCSTPTQIFPLNETALQSSTAISSGATSAGVFYTPNGTTVANVPMKILGFIEYAANVISTPGTYTFGPSKVQLFGGAIPRPGTLVGNTTSNSNAAVIQVESSSLANTNISSTATLTSPVNQIRYLFSTTWGMDGGGSGVNAWGVYRGASLVGFQTTLTTVSSQILMDQGYDAPNLGTATYTLKILNVSGTSFYVPHASTGTLGPALVVLEEIMG